MAKGMKECITAVHNLLMMIYKSKTTARSIEQQRHKGEHLNRHVIALDAQVNSDYKTMPLLELQVGLRK